MFAEITSRFALQSLSSVVKNYSRRAADKYFFSQNAQIKHDKLALIFMFSIVSLWCNMFFLFVSLNTMRVYKLHMI